MADFPFRKTPLKQFASIQHRETAEGRYWRRFRHPSVQQYAAPCTSLHFSPIAPFDLAISTSLSVVVLDSKTQSVKKTLSRFNDVSYSASFRHDGRLISVGGEEGVVRTFDSTTGSSLRQLRGHSAAVSRTICVHCA
jgi:U3 small nucleolar RNA-associated protein 15